MAWGLFVMGAMFLNAIVSLFCFGHQLSFVHFIEPVFGDLCGGLS
jgi:hypothetical protein